MREFSIGDMVTFWKRDTLRGIVIAIIKDPLINYDYGLKQEVKYRYIIEWLWGFDNGFYGNGYMGYDAEHLIKVSS